MIREVQAAASAGWTVGQQTGTPLYLAVLFNPQSSNRVVRVKRFYMVTMPAAVAGSVQFELRYVMGLPAGGTVYGSQSCGKFRRQEPIAEFRHADNGANAYLAITGLLDYGSSIAGIAYPLTLTTVAVTPTGDQVDFLKHGDIVEIAPGMGLGVSQRGAFSAGGTYLFFGSFWAENVDEDR